MTDRAHRRSPHDLVEAPYPPQVYSDAVGLIAFLAAESDRSPEETALLAALRRLISEPWLPPGDALASPVPARYARVANRWRDNAMRGAL